MSYFIYNIIIIDQNFHFQKCEAGPRCAEEAAEAPEAIYCDYKWGRGRAEIYYEAGCEEVEHQSVGGTNGGGGVERGFGSVPVHSVFLFPSCEMRYFQYAASRVKYTHVVSRPSLAAPGMMRRMFFAKFFLLFCRTPPLRRLLSHHAVRSWVGI